MPKYPEKMREMIAETIRSNIHDAAIELIREHGWDAFTTEKIAEKVGVSRGVLYNYFKNKEDIAEFIIMTAFDEMIEKLRAAADRQTSASERILEMAQINVSHFINQREMHRTLMEKMPPPNRRRHKKNPPPLRIAKVFGEVITDGVKSGEFNDINLDAASKLLVGGLHEICIHSTFTNTEPEVKPLVEIFLKGIKK